MKKHYTLPVRLDITKERTFIRSAEGHVFCECQAETIELEEGNSELICKAVNNYPNLVEALHLMVLYHPPVTQRIGQEGSMARGIQEDQETAIKFAKEVLSAIR